MRTAATWILAIGLLAVDLAEASTVPVPEPTSLTLLLVGGGAIGARTAWKAWRRSRKS